MSNDKQTHILRSLIGVVLALVVFIVVTLVGNAALKLLDAARGNRNLLQDFAREVGMPAFDVSGWPVIAHVERCASLKNTSRDIWKGLNKE